MKSNKDYSTSRSGEAATPALPEMAYVAADPLQPGAAWACIVDEPRYAKDAAKEVARWIRQGANVMRVDVDTARAMLMKWERPGKNKAKPDVGLFSESA